MRRTLVKMGRALVSALAVVLLLGTLALQIMDPGAPDRDVALAVAKGVEPAAGDAARLAAPRDSRARQRERSENAACPGGLVRVSGTDFCTHGPDPAPPGLDVQRRVALLPARAARAARDLPCDGDGVSGYRVQVLYVRGDGTPDRFNDTLLSIRGWTAGADEIMQESAAATGGERRFRFVMDDCQLDVQPVVLPQAEVGDFGDMIGALRARGYQRSDRYYLSFVDLAETSICGIATYWRDDRPRESNRNNSGPGYSRVDPGCWDAGVAAHELLHNLGGVQDTAPHATPHGHCIDEWDVMCYRDSGSVQMQTICADHALNDRFDCRNDDYFHTRPPAGSYLATHWNTANNRFLVGSEAFPNGDTGAPIVAITNPRRGTNLKARKRITIAVTATDAGTGVAAVEFRRCRSNACTWDRATEMGVDTSAPYTRQWKLPKRGTFTFLARATDQEGNIADASPVTIRVKAKKKR